MIVYLQYVFQDNQKILQREHTTHIYFRLCESYRDANSFPRQRLVMGLGRLFELQDIDQRILFLERLNELIIGIPTLFSMKIGSATNNYKKTSKWG